jgi:hypothetical protein
VTDQITVLPPHLTTAIVKDYLQLGCPRDPAETIKRLIEVLNNQELAAAIRRVQEGYGFMTPNSPAS